MTGQERLWQTFRDMPNQQTLYQTSDGEVFVELEDAQYYASSLEDSAVQTYNRPNPVPPAPATINPNGVWINIPDKQGTVFWLRN
jgi:hypothetical protein